MARSPKPWYWKARKACYVTLGGTRIRLADSRPAALTLFHELMAQPMRCQVAGNSVVALIDLFLEWTQLNRSAGTYRWYHEFPQAFVNQIPPTLTVRELRPFHVQRQNLVTGRIVEPSQIFEER